MSMRYRHGRGLALAGLVVALISVLAGCGSRPAAIVNGVKITEAELNQRLRQEAGAKVLAAMIDAEIIKDAFEKANLQITEEDINQAIIEAFGSLDNFQRQTAQARVNAQEIIERGLKPRIMLEKLATKDLKYTDADLQQFYAKNKERYDIPEKVSVRRILVPDKAGADKVMAALKSGADFAAVVRQYSTDIATRETGGLLPAEIPVKEIPPEVRQVLDGLKEGQYSQPVPVGQEYMILKLEKRTPGQKQTFEQVKSAVARDFLRSKLTQQAILELRNRLRQQARVNVVAPEFQALNEEFRPTEVPEFGAGTTAAPQTSPPAQTSPTAPAPGP